MAWEQPEWLSALLAVPPIMAFFAWVHLRRRRWARAFVSANLLRGIPRGRRILQYACYVLSYVFLILALAGPKWGYHWEEVHRRGLDIFIGLDLSKSMLAEDVKPNRLERAKREISDMLDALPSDRVGIIAFSGASYVVCPLTLDRGVLRMFLDDLRVGQIEPGGTDIGSVIARALQSFKRTAPEHRVILLITDGEDLEGRVLAAAAKAREQGVKIFCVGIGGGSGAPVPIVDKGGHKRYLKDRNGNTVVSKPDGQTLQKIALDTGGAYLAIGGGAFQLASFYKNQLAVLEKAELGESRRKIFENRYQWPLSVALLLLWVGFIIADKWRLPKALSRKVAPLLLLLPFLGGWSPTDSGKVADANRLFEQGKYNEAQEGYMEAQAGSPDADELYYNLGNVKYRVAEYAQAQEMFQRALEAPQEALRQQAHYNLGNVKVRQGQLEEALNLYKKAMELDADDEDAKFNYEWVKNKIEQMQQESGQQQEQRKQEQQQEQQQDQQQQQQQRQDQQEQEQQANPEGQQEQQSQRPKPQQAPMLGQQQDKQQDPQDQQGQQELGDKRELSKDEAEALLQWMQEEERRARTRQSAPPAQDPTVERDW